MQSSDDNINGENYFYIFRMTDKGVFARKVIL